MMELLTNYIGQGLAAVKALSVACIPKSSYYYQLKVETRSVVGLPGRRPPGFTLRWTEGGWVKETDAAVIKFLEHLLSLEFIDYGYRKCHSSLGNNGYHINHKKVYRLMKTEGLLRGSRIQTTGKVERAGGRMVCPARPFVFLEMDIKYLYIRGEGRTIFLLTIIDTHSRYALDYSLGYQMTQVEVKQLWQRALSSETFKAYGPDSVEKVTVRNDNGSQFIAGSVKEFFAGQGIKQEFTHVATPEENAHIESFHSILEEALVGIDFEARSNTATWLETFYKFYNTERLHSSICDLFPGRFLVAWTNGLIGHDFKHGRLVFYLKIKRYLLTQTLEEIISLPAQETTPPLSEAAGTDVPHEVKGASVPATSDSDPDSTTNPATAGNTEYGQAKPS
jgi:transposase InsO family protein